MQITLPNLTTRAKRRSVAAEATPGRVADEPLEQLLRRYGRRRTLAVRDQIVERCRPVVEGMARSLCLRLPRCVDVQDLIHAGMCGLMRAIEKYEPSRCDQFLPFLRIRARGAMLDELRGMDFLPRQHRRRLRERERAMEQLRQELAREPSDGELAAALGISLQALQTASIETRSQPWAEGWDAGDGDSDALDRLPDGSLESPLEALDRRDLLQKIQDCLQPIEWQVLQLHYLEGLSGKDIARRLRLSASRICQIHVRVVDRLKERLGN